MAEKLNLSLGSLRIRRFGKRDFKPKPGEIWDTLGEPSGKYDYMVKYSPPPSYFSEFIPVAKPCWDENGQPKCSNDPWDTSGSPRSPLLEL